VNTYEKVDAALAALSRNQRSLTAGVTRRSAWLMLRAVGAVPAVADPTALCLDRHRHRLPTARIPCVECVADAAPPNRGGADQRARDWSDGWLALSAEIQRQDEDPSYPIGRDAQNPFLPKGQVHP